ncbi:ABC transporter permease [Candidatus Gracilibacteria bacterium]|nr:ABC transporter permease [Candidatus Gracilibacteria bacterium]
MQLGRTINLAIRNMLANKMRAGLSSLGIIIGVFSVVVLLAVGQGATSKIVEQVSSLGTNLLTVRPGGQNSGDVRRSTTNNQKIFNIDHIEIIGKIDHVAGVSPLVSISSQVIYSANNTNATINGVLPVYEKVNNAVVVSGIFITEKANNDRDKVAVIGSTVVTNLFGTMDPLGKTIRIGKTLFTVVGVLKEKGTSIGSTDNAIFIPLSTAQISLLGSNSISTISVMVDSEENMEIAKTAITEKLLSVFKITDPEKATFTVSSQAETLDTLSTITNTLKIFLGGIAAISLFVGGIGVMNILLVTVSERTKEIGIRKAIGAKSRDIIEQFLVESVLLTLFGGIIGILLSYGIVGLINTFFAASITAKISSGQILLALSFSIGTGLFFGIFPAYKAAKMKPIDALRSE